MIRERQAEGIAQAKAAGTYKRSARLSAQQVVEARERVAAGISKAAVARDLACHVKRSTWLSRVRACTQRNEREDPDHRMVTEVFVFNLWSSLLRAPVA